MPYRIAKVCSSIAAGDVEHPLMHHAIFAMYMILHKAIDDHVYLPNVSGSTSLAAAMEQQVQQAGLQQHLRALSWQMPEKC